MGKNTDSILSILKSNIMDVLKEKGFLENEWHFGTIKTVNPNKTADLYIDGARDLAKNVPYNPDITLQAADKVIILYVNRNKNNRYIMCKKR